MDQHPPLRLSTSAAVKEKRLLALLAGRDPHTPELRAAIEAAQVRGSLELAGVAATLEETRAAQRGEAVARAVGGLVRALRAVDPREPFTARAALIWHGAVIGPGGLRTTERERPEGPPAAPPAFIASRLAALEQWLQEPSVSELQPAQQGALALARLHEIAPFSEGNGRVARLAASHLMVRAGARPPVLEGSDAPRLAEALRAAFQLHTGPLVALLEEASLRAVDVLIRALSTGG